MTITEAASFARRGRYTEASAVLAGLGGLGSTDPRVLDLLARVYAQQGDLVAADECWAAVQRLDGDHSAADAGRRRIAELRSRRHRSGTARTVGLVALAGVVGVLAGVALRPGADPDLAAQLHRVQDGQQALTGKVSDLSAKLSQESTHREQLLAEVRAALSGGPVSASEGHGGVELSFSEGLFSALDRLSPAGRAALTELAGRLKKYCAELSVQIVGHTENALVSPDSGFVDNTDLALRRARVAAEQLAEATGLPASAFQLGAGGAVFDQTKPGADPARNRTVTLLLHPA
ncbi:OmpA family protein [Kutzneria albida]|uniref:OmpA-like domain-containing protein n=1 Tax=Kutzneria albida DSM 43870 TaxID=1449976 RepID=W5WG72_9PSEU|nr:OmpA family protein [Kutzneria albida]AHH99611.1 hypothetical protein KALB_6251 [Kutzneria albida DSM 43870]